LSILSVKGFLPYSSMVVAKCVFVYGRTIMMLTGNHCKCQW